MSHWFSSISEVSYNWVHTCETSLWLCIDHLQKWVASGVAVKSELYTGFIPVKCPFQPFQRWVTTGFTLTEPPLGCVDHLQRWVASGVAVKSEWHTGFIRVKCPLGFQPLQRWVPTRFTLVEPSLGCIYHLQEWVASGSSYRWHLALAVCHERHGTYCGMPLWLSTISNSYSWVHTCGTSPQLSTVFKDDLQ